MIGREEELECLEKLYNSKKFEFLVLYGRRRIGKTTLLTEFAKKHNSLYFLSQEKNTTLNLTEFAELTRNYFGMDYVPKVEDWYQMINLLSERIELKLSSNPSEKICIIIDEFPFIAKEYPTIKSILQHAIDQKWQYKNIMLVLCGSSVSFMVNEVLGYSSPLYGRRTANMELKQLNYLDASKFFPSFSNLDKLTAYAILGGIPYYLKTFNDKLSLKQNISENIFKDVGILREEPLFLLKQEFREPTIYNSIIEAIATGFSKFNEISQKIKEETSKCASYMKNLQEVRIIDKVIPYGENANSKKSIYMLSDFFFRFWYKYVFSNSSLLSLLGEEKYTEKIFLDISSTLGSAFEQICLQYLVLQARKGKLPFIPNGLGKWWGNNPKKKSQDDIDIMGISGNQGIFCECKFRNEKFDLSEFNDLISASEIFSNITDRYYYIFVKSGYTQAVVDESKKYKVKLLTIDDLFYVD
jgi:uncharacterized protein